MINYVKMIDLFSQYRILLILIFEQEKDERFKNKIIKMIN
jgi:hypothetical protein